MNPISWFKNHLENKKRLENQVNYIENLIDSYPTYFKEGTFEVKLLTRNLYYIKSKETISFIQNLDGQFGLNPAIRFHTLKRSLAYFIKLIVYRSISFKIENIRNEESNKYNCELIIPIFGNGGIKAFSLSEKKVLRFFTDRCAFENTLKVINATPEELNTAILEIDRDKMIVIEDLIISVPLKEISYQKLDKIFEYYHDDLLKFIRRISNEEFLSLSIVEVYKFFKENIFEQELLSIIENNIDVVQLFNYTPIIHLLHFKNDLSYQNFLISEDGYALIDFEKAMFTSVYNLFLAIKKNLSLSYRAHYQLKKFKNGEYDKTFKHALNNFNQIYNSDLKLEYFFLSLLPYDIYLQHKKNSDEKISHETIEYINIEIKAHLENYLSL